MMGCSLVGVRKKRRTQETGQNWKKVFSRTRKEKGLEKTGALGLPLQLPGKGKNCGTVERGKKWIF